MGGFTNSYKTPKVWIPLIYEVKGTHPWRFQTNVVEPVSSLVDGVQGTDTAVPKLHPVYGYACALERGEA